MRDIASNTLKFNTLAIVSFYFYYESVPEWVGGKGTSGRGRANICENSEEEHTISAECASLSLCSPMAPKLPPALKKPRLQ